MEYKKYENELLRLHNDLGLLSAYTENKQEWFKAKRKDFLVKEAWARYVLACIFFQINPNIELRQHPQLDTFDADITSGETIVQVEGKCRNFKSNRYPTDNISVGKGDEIIKEGGFLTIFFNDDGVYRVYDLSKYRPGKSEWKHTHYTAEGEDLENYKQVEECWTLDPAEALFTGRLVKRNGARKTGDS